MSLYRSVVTLALLFALALPALAREPMKLDSEEPAERILDRRILTRPGAVLAEAPDGTAIKKPPVFTAYYVFASETRDGTEWLEIGANRDGNETGWMRADSTVLWKQTIVLGFNSPVDRIPVLFFEDSSSLETFIGNETMSTRAELLAESVRSDGSVEGSGVIAVEPAEQVSITEQFYLLPILDAKDVRVNRRLRRIVEVASINQEALPIAPATEAQPFRVGIVFVVDTSTSMGPYIERTREAITRILEGVTSDAERTRVSFGIVGFRGDVRAVPGLDYTVHEFHPLASEFDEAAFLSALNEVQATTVSSLEFDEDGLAGLAAAAEMPGWSDFDGRYIIYISDAGMLVGEDQGSVAGITPDLFASRAQGELGIATFSLFLQTRAGRAYHDEALAQLGSISRSPGAGAPLVFPIEDGSVEQFGAQVDHLTRSLLEQVRQTADSRPPPPTVCETNPDDIACSISDVGQAMRLAWLGRQQQAQAPDTYQAWAADFALDDPSRRAMSPRVLLTRDQLNDLYVTLQAITEAFSAPDTDPATFFSALKTTLARMMRDPSQIRSLDPSLGTAPAQIDAFDNLGDLLGGYFAGLPYRSDLASISEETWMQMSDASRREVIEAVKAKMTMYELYYADAASWVTINPDAGDGEKVYPVLLEMMP